MSIFSGKNQRLASIQAMMQSQQTEGEIAKLLQGAQATGTDALTQGREGALQELKQGADNGIAAINAGEPLSLDALRQGAASAKGYFQPYATTGGAAFGQAADAAGVNGPEGSDRATSAFRASPGYQYRVDQALDQVARKASATGALASGNTLTALQDRAGNEADQEFGTYYGRLNDIGRVGYDASGRMASIDSDLGKGEAGIYSGDAAARAGLYSGAGQSSANAYTGTGQGLASLSASLAGSGANALSHEGDQMIQGINSAYKAGDDASKNAWGLGMGLAGLASSLGGAYLGGPKSFLVKQGA